jgi:hypothetical protein
MTGDWQAAVNDFFSVLRRWYRAKNLYANIYLVLFQNLGDRDHYQMDEKYRILLVGTPIDPASFLTLFTGADRGPGRFRWDHNNFVPNLICIKK